MGRRQSPIADTGPIGHFAAKLRERHERARRELGTSLTFREISRAVQISHTVLAKAEGGHELPTLAVVKAMIKHFGGDESELQQWHDAHAATVTTLADLQRRHGDPAVALNTGERQVVPVPGRPIHLQRTTPAAEWPVFRLDLVNTFEDLQRQLRLLKLVAGDPSIRMTTKDCTILSKVRQGHYAYGPSRSTIGDIFVGKHRPSYENFCIVVEVLIHRTNPERIGLPSLAEWSYAWSRANHNRTQPDVTRLQVSNISVISDHQTESPTAAIIAAMKPEAAAGLLIGMSPKIAGDVMTELMPTGKAQPILEAMWTLTSTKDSRPVLPSNVFRLPSPELHSG